FNSRRLPTIISDGGASSPFIFEDTISIWPTVRASRKAQRDTIDGMRSDWLNEQIILRAIRGAPGVPVDGLRIANWQEHPYFGASDGVLVGDPAHPSISEEARLRMIRDAVSGSTSAKGSPSSELS